MKLEAAEADDDVAPLTGLRLRDQAGTHFRRYPHCVDLFNGYFFLNLSTPGLENADGRWLAAFFFAKIASDAGVQQPNAANRVSCTRQSAQ